MVLRKSKKNKELVCITKEGHEICLPGDRIGKIMDDQENQRSPWRIFKIMSEFVEGFEFLSRFKKTVSIYGSTRCNFNHTIYEEATKLAKKLAKDGFTIITGGGPGVMEAANKGAYEAGGTSVGLNITLLEPQGDNKYLTDRETFSYFFTRKVMLSLSSQVYIFFPGGFGTMDELFEMLTLIQTKKIERIPIVIVGVEYWTPLLDWIEQKMYHKNKAIDKDDMALYHLVDTADEAYDYINKKLTFKKK